MASDEATIRRIAHLTAREVINQLQNEHGLVTLPEAQQLASAINSNASEFFCKSCGHPLSSDEVKKDRCGVCGGRQAVDAPPYRCIRCNEPVSLKQQACLKCGETQAIPATKSREI